MNSLFQKITTYFYTVLLVINLYFCYQSDFIFSYYLATEEDNPRRRQLYRIKANTKPYLSECLSCDTEKNCTYIGAQYSLKRSYYVQTCIGKAIPTINIYDKVSCFILIV